MGGMVKQMLPIYFADIGVRDDGIQLGLIHAIYSLFQIISGTIMGLSAKTWAMQRQWLCISMCGAALSYSLVGLAYAYKSVALLFVSRAVVGITKQSATLSKHVISCQTSPATRSRALGRLQAVSFAGFATGPAIGGLLTQWSVLAPIFVAVSCYVANILVLLPLTSFGDASGESSTQAKKRRLSTTSYQALDRLRVLWKQGDTRLMRVLAVAGFYKLTYSASEVYSATYEMDRFNVSAVELGMLTTYERIICVVTNLAIVAAVVARVSEMWCLVGAGLFLVVVRVLESAAFVDLRWLLALKVLIAVGKTLIKTPGEALVTLSVPQDSIGTAFAIKNILSGVILFFGPLYGRHLKNTFGATSAPLLEGVHWLMFVLVALALLEWPPLPSSKEREKER